MNPTTVTTAETKPRQSFQVYDDFGRIWPPGFKSQTCDPTSPFSMISHADKAREAAAQKRERDDQAITAQIAAMAESKADQMPPTPAPGTPPEYKMRMGAPESQERVNSRRYRYSFRRTADAPLSITEVAWYRLRGLPAGSEVTCRQFAVLVLKTPGEVRQALEAAVQAGVFLAEPRGSCVVYTLGTTVPVGAPLRSGPTQAETGDNCA